MEAVSLVCRSCHSKNLIDILSLGNQYLSDFREDNQLPAQYPLDLILCQDCKLLQLKQTTPSDLLYTENYGYKSGINNTIRADLKEIVEKAEEKVSLGLGDVVLDIGCNDGTLLSNYPDFVTKIGFDPIKKLADEARQHADIIYNDFWNYKAYEGNPRAKVITIISCFYDLDEPNSFVEDIAQALHTQGVCIIQQNYLGGMIKQHAFDNVVHEHLEFYSLTALENLLNRHGLEVFDVELNSINGGSFRTYVRHMDMVKKMRVFEKKLGLDDPQTYLKWGKEIEGIGKQVLTFVKEVNSQGKSVYLYGASTRGNTLIQYCGLDKTLIKAAVERNPEKWGKIISSLQIPIISEEQARIEKPDYMLVLPWFFKEEFLEREKEYLEGGGHFIFALPEFEVV